MLFFGTNLQADLELDEGLEKLLNLVGVVDGIVLAVGHDPVDPLLPEDHFIFGVLDPDFLHGVLAEGLYEVFPDLFIVRTEPLRRVEKHDRGHDRADGGDSDQKKKACVLHFAAVLNLRVMPTKSPMMMTRVGVSSMLVHS